MPFFSPQHRGVAVLLSTALLLSACSSSSDDGSTPSDSTNETADETGGSTNETGDETGDEIAVEAGDDSSGGATADGGVALADPSGSHYLGSYTLDDEQFGTQVTVTVVGETRTIKTNALPNHVTGDFPNDGNPNTIAAQDVTYQYPTVSNFVGGETFAMTPGVAVNGVKFEPATAETVTCDSGETYRVEALQEVYNLGLDFNNAHVQPTGEYHYHGASALLNDAYATDSDLVHIGFAADGYLMYYSKSGAFEPGYRLSSEVRSGEGCVGSGALRTDTVEVAGTTPDGTYSSDWVWSDAAGDLDSCNGVTIDGTYAYIITDTYPFIGRCLNGEAAANGPGGGAPPPGGDGNPGAGGDGAAGAPGAGAGPGGAEPDLTEAAATLGVTVDELREALGPPPPDFAAAAVTLGVSEDALRAAVPRPGQ